MKAQKTAKKRSTKRMRYKRLKEQVYLAHFLAVNGIQPERIISGKDDGKEPDFTLVLHGKYIGVELTTLPRLRECMGNEHLVWRRIYWSVLRMLSLGHTKQYDPHHRHDSRHTPANIQLNQQQQSNQQHHKTKNTQPKQPKQLSSAHPPTLYVTTLYATALYATTPCSPRPLSPKTQPTHFLHAFKKRLLALARFIEATIPPSQSYFVNPQSALSLSSLSLSSAQTVPTQNIHNPSHTTPASMSYITQQDIDAVMTKKADKVAAYHSRRPLDALWLLIHTNQNQQIQTQQKQTTLAMPRQHLVHASDYDAVWLTTYPSKQAYQIQTASKKMVA